MANPRPEGSRQLTVQKRLTELERAHGILKRKVSELADRLNINRNSENTLLGWVNHKVLVTTTQRNIEGRLLWVDKYSYGIADNEDADDPIVIHKGQTVTIERA